MKLIRGWHNLASFPELSYGSAVTIGNFDGVHCGHQAILQRLKDKAIALNVPSVVMLFEPQPKEFFAQHYASENQPPIAPARLMRLRDKLHFLSKLGVDFVFCVRFNLSFAHLQAVDFIENYLVKQLKVRYLSVGDDFSFGANRTGNFDTLQEAGKKLGFLVEDNQTLSFNDRRVSSSLIREALRNDDLELATKLLGKPYSISGRVAHGNKLGRTIGFPTANIALNRLVTPIQGVYSVKIIIAGKLFWGIANVGNRPTINGIKPLLEVHIFDFEQSIYGQTLEVIFCHKIRNEIKFNSFDELKAQISKDITQVRAFFAKH